MIQRRITSSADQIDETPPVMTEVPDVGKLNEVSATIEWETNEDSDSRLRLGLNADLSDSSAFEEVYDPTPTRSHAVDVEDLLPETDYYYRAVFSGTNAVEAATSPTRYVAVQAYITTPSGPSRTYARRSFVMAGYLKPKHKAGQYSVRLDFYRWNGRSWSSALARSARSCAVIIFWTIGSRSWSKNMCSVRVRPIPSAPYDLARVASAG